MPFPSLIGKFCLMWGKWIGGGSGRGRCSGKTGRGGGRGRKCGEKKSKKSEGECGKRGREQEEGKKNEKGNGEINILMEVLIIKQKTESDAHEQADSKASR